MTKENMYEGYVRILNDNYLGLPYIKVNTPEVKINTILNIKPDIKPIKVIYNNPATIVFWNDNTKTVVVCDKEDTYNKETGFLMCLGKKLYGKHDFFKMLNEFCYKED